MHTIFVFLPIIKKSFFLLVALIFAAYASSLAMAF